MPEELKVDCHECKDLEFARNLAKSMKEGYGRHNSRRDFRYMNFFEAMHRESLEELINLQARVIGRIGDKSIRERWEDCEIGDAVPDDKVPELKDHNFRVVIAKHKTMPIHFWPEGLSIPMNELPNFDKLTFERVRMDMVDAGGYRSTQDFWKRIS